MKLLDLIIEKKESTKKFSREDRIKMYEEYYKNLSPDNFKVKKNKKGDIVITLPK